MPDIQNSEQMIPNYKKVIHPLEVLVSIVNSTTPSSKFSITINLKGTMISGDLVSLREFHDHISYTLMAGSEDETDPEAVRGMRDIVNAMKGLYENPGFKDLVNSYVCIKNPKFLLGSITLPLDGHFWIGKIESVDGFMNLSLSPPRSSSIE